MDFLFSGLRTREPPAPAGASLRTSVLHGWSSRMWRGNRRVLVLLSITPALLFLYLWSLGEGVHVVVKETAFGCVANVQGADLGLKMLHRNGHIGGCRSRYRLDR